MIRYQIETLLAIILLLSTKTTITTTFAFLRPRSVGLRTVPSFVRHPQSASGSSSLARNSLTESNRALLLPLMVVERIMVSSDHSGKKRSLSATATDCENDNQAPPPLYLEEGLFAVHKPLGWTSQDVVGKLRFLLEADARARKAPDRRTKKRRPWMKVGHGGTLDPLATGVLVCGVGSGTKNLQKYLVGSKAYRAEITLGYQTTTLDADPKGEIIERKQFDHVTSLDHIKTVLQTKFTGNIQQVPPIFSALKRDGKKLYELGRQGQTAEDLKIEPREVTIYDLKLVGNIDNSSEGKPIEKFFIDVECGGGTYIRSLVRDIGIALGTVATMTKLERTKQGQFLLEHSLPYSSSIETDNDEIKRNEKGEILIEKREDCNWTIDSINKAIRKCRETVLASEDDGLRDK